MRPKSPSPLHKPSLPLQIFQRFTIYKVQDPKKDYWTYATFLDTFNFSFSFFFIEPQMTSAFQQLEGWKLILPRLNSIWQFMSVLSLPLLLTLFHVCFQSNFLIQSNLISFSFLNFIFIFHQIKTEKQLILHYQQYCVLMQLSCSEQKKV